MEVGGISRNAHTYASSGLELLVSVSRFSYNHRSYHEPCLFEEKLVGLKFLKIMSNYCMLACPRTRRQRTNTTRTRSLDFLG